MRYVGPILLVGFIIFLLISNYMDTFIQIKAPSLKTGVPYKLILTIFFMEGNFIGWLNNCLYLLYIFFVVSEAFSKKFMLLT